MIRLKKIFPKVSLIMILATIVACFGLPMLTSLLGLSKIHRLIFLFFILNSILVIASAWTIRHWSLSGWWLLLFPTIFALSVWWRFAQYNYWLVGIYLILGLITYLLLPHERKNRRHHKK